MSIPIALALAATVAAIPVAAADGPSVTIYRADGDALFTGGDEPVADGYAMVHELRPATPVPGQQAVVIEGLPSLLDAEAVNAGFDGGTKILAQRVVSAGNGGRLAAHRSQPVRVLAADGHEIVSGTLESIDSSGLGIRTADGSTSYVHDYARVVFAPGSGAAGSTLRLALGGRPAHDEVNLAYPTSGLGWRASYSAALADGADCRIQLTTLASIANRSGRDYDGARLTLIAGSPNFASGYPPRPMMKAMAAAAPMAEAMPEQSSLGDYRSYALASRIDLPDASVTLVPLYDPADLDCTRRWIFETGGAWFPAKPQTVAGHDGRQGGPVRSELAFEAQENLPAGKLRVLTRDKGALQFLGASNIADTPKGRKVDITVGTAFQLTAERERTAFKLDRAAREMTEGFRISLGNTGDAPRTITVREHPNRWRNWTLAASSTKPDKVTPDLLEFRVPVPADGKAVLDYTVRYHWTSADE